MTDRRDVLVVRDDGVVEVPRTMPWPAWLANVAEHCVRAQIGAWPGDEERYWLTEKAMREVEA